MKTWSFKVEKLISEKKLNFQMNDLWKSWTCEQIEMDHSK